MENEKPSETVNKAKKAAEEELSKIERYLFLIEREIERILLVQRILERNSELREKNFN